MRKRLSCALLLMVLASTPVLARPSDPADGGGLFDRIVRIMKAVWTLRVTDDLPLPPPPTP